MRTSILRFHHKSNTPAKVLYFPLIWVIALLLSTLFFVNCNANEPKEGKPCENSRDCLGSLVCTDAGECQKKEDDTEKNKDGSVLVPPDHVVITDSPRETKPTDKTTISKVNLTAIEGDGRASSIVYGNDTKPANAQEASKRFQTHWILKGTNLDLISKLSLKSIASAKVFPLTLQSGSKTERKTRLPENLTAGLFALVATIDSKKVELAHVKVLRGEKGDKGPAGDKGPDGDKGKKGDRGDKGQPHDGVISANGKTYTSNGVFAGAAKDPSGKEIVTQGLIQGGWNKLKSLCEDSYGKTAHMCTEEEVYRSIQLGLLGKFSGLTGDGFWYATSKNGANNCYDWTINTSSGTGGFSGAMGWFVNTDGSNNPGRCEYKRRIACCK